MSDLATTTPPASASEVEQTATTPLAVAVTGATTYRGRRIQQLERERDELREALHTVLVEGKSYTLSNSHGVTRADVPEIEARLAAVTEELAGLMLRTPYQPLRRVPTKFC